MTPKQDQEAGLTPSDVSAFITNSDVQVGILFKKSDTSMATFLKSYNLETESAKMKSQRLLKIRGGTTSTRGT
jgi:hypothetical protein